MQLQDDVPSLGAATDWSKSKRQVLVDTKKSGLCGAGGADLGRGVNGEPLLFFHAWTCPERGTAPAATTTTARALRRPTVTVRGGAEVHQASVAADLGVRRPDRAAALTHPHSDSDSHSVPHRDGDGEAAPLTRVSGPIGRGGYDTAASSCRSASSR